MLNYNNWKKLNENMSFNLGVKSPNNMGVMMDKYMGSYMKDEEDNVEDEEMEDEEHEDEDEVEDEVEEDEVDEIDMEDAEDEEGEDEEDESEDEDEGDESEDESDESEDEGSDSSETEDMLKDSEMDNEKNCWSKCGSYMASENTMPKHIPSLEDWQKSVASMLDNSCVTKANFDGVVNEEAALTGAVKAKVGQLATALDRQNLGMPQLKTLAHQIIKMLHGELTEKISDSATKTNLLNNIKLAFKEAAASAEATDGKQMKMNMKKKMKKK